MDGYSEPVLALCSESWIWEVKLGIRWSENILTKRSTIPTLCNSDSHGLRSIWPTKHCYIYEKMIRIIRVEYLYVCGIFFFERAPALAPSLMQPRMSPRGPDSPNPNSCPSDETGTTYITCMTHQDRLRQIIGTRPVARKMVVGATQDPEPCRKPCRTVAGVKWVTGIERVKIGSKNVVGTRCVGL